ncbi:hypothetical protein LguiB_027795 [Lonicera macranthoides]
MTKGKEEQPTNQDGDGSSHEIFGESSSQKLPEIEARFCNGSVFFKIHCERQKGVIVKIISAIENMNLAVANTSVSPFGTLAHDVTITAEVELLFELIKGLIKDLDGPPEDEPDEEDFKEEQNSVARLIHMLYNDDPEEMLKIISTVRKHIMIGGPKRLRFTVPPLVFSALKQDGMNLESMWGEDNINSSDEANLQFEDDELDSDEEGTVHNESSDGDIIRYQTSFEHFEEDGESLMRLFNKVDIRADRRLNITIISSEVFEEASRGNGVVKLAVYKVPTVSDGSIEVDMGDSGEVDSSVFLESIDSNTILNVVIRDRHDRSTSETSQRVISKESHNYKD